MTVSRTEDEQGVEEEHPCYTVVDKEGDAAFALWGYFQYGIDVPDGLCAILVTEDGTGDVISTILIDFLGHNALGAYIPAMDIVIVKKRAHNNESLAQVEYLYTLYHELFHAWQDEYLESFDGLYERWEDTPAGQEFIEMAGLTEVNGEWRIDNPHFQGVYGADEQGIINPTELSAELGGAYMLLSYVLRPEDNYYSQSPHSENNRHLLPYVSEIFILNGLNLVGDAGWSYFL